MSAMMSSHDTSHRSQTWEPKRVAQEPCQRGNGEYRHFQWQNFVQLKARRLKTISRDFSGLSSWAKFQHSRSLIKPEFTLNNAPRLLISPRLSEDVYRRRNYVQRRSRILIERESSTQRAFDSDLLHSRRRKPLSASESAYDKVLPGRSLCCSRRIQRIPRRDANRAASNRIASTWLGIVRDMQWDTKKPAIFAEACKIAQASEATHKTANAMKKNTGLLAQETTHKGWRLSSCNWYDTDEIRNPPQLCLMAGAETKPCRGGQVAMIRL